MVSIGQELLNVPFRNDRINDLGYSKRPGGP